MPSDSGDFARFRPRAPPVSCAGGADRGAEWGPVGRRPMAGQPSRKPRPSRRQQPWRRRVRLKAYHVTGHALVAKTAPHLVVERVANPAVPDDVLTPLERVVRAWRLEVLEDLGGLDTVPAAKRAVFDAATGSMIILSSLDAFIAELAGSGRGLVNRRARFAYRIVHDRRSVADSLVKQLQALGLDRLARPPVDLSQYLAERRPAASAPDAAPTEGDPHVDNDVREIDPDAHAGL